MKGTVSQSRVRATTTATLRSAVPATPPGAIVSVPRTGHHHPNYLFPEEFLSVIQVKVSVPRTGHHHPNRKSRVSHWRANLEVLAPKSPVFSLKIRVSYPQGSLESAPFSHRRYL